MRSNIEYSYPTPHLRSTANPAVVFTAVPLGKAKWVQKRRRGG